MNITTKMLESVINLKKRLNPYVQLLQSHRLSDTFLSCPEKPTGRSPTDTECRVDSSRSGPWHSFLSLTKTQSGTPVLSAGYIMLYTQEKVDNLPNLFWEWGRPGRPTHKQVETS